MPDINLWLFRSFNGVAGHSWYLDSVVALAMANELIKSATIGACFFAGWYPAAAPVDMLTARRSLLIALVAAIFTLATTTVISHAVLQPRPYLQAHKVYQLKGNQLEEMPRLTFRRPLDNRAQERELAFKAGNIPPNDLGSFPSDHAGFFMCLSLGIWLASRRIGVVALAWTLFVILSGKLITGMHMPLEVAVSCLVAVVWLIACHYFARTWFDGIGDRIALWTTQHTSLTAAALFIALFEAASTFDHVKALIAAMGKHI